ncbi:hypothetical protein KFS98_003659 [Salmonella enterica]|nr:hypothetical protein [Salmonella enterica]
MKPSKIAAAIMNVVVAVNKTYADTSVGALDFTKDFIDDDSIDFTGATATVGDAPLTWTVTMSNGDQLGVHMPGHPDDPDGSVFAVDGE